MRVTVCSSIVVLATSCSSSSGMEPMGPSVPKLHAPVRNAYLGSIFNPSSLKPKLSWSSSTAPNDAPVFYQVEISTDASFISGTTVETTETTSYEPPQALAVSLDAPVGARFYWRVRACLAENECSKYSATWWFNLGRSDQDFNGDGFADVVVGATLQGASGRAYVYFGGAAGTFEPTADGVLVGVAFGDLLGSSVASAGDVNGDGFADVVVGAVLNDIAGKDAGSAHIYYGGPGATFDSVPDGTLIGTMEEERFGASVASAGDVNGDGFGDVIVGAWEGPGSGRAYLYLGGPRSSFDATVYRTFTGPGQASGFGVSVASAGDVNNDGFADIIVGAHGPGAAYLHYGGAGKDLDTIANITLTGEASLALFGASVASAGDINGDGFHDILVGAPAHQSNTGAVYVYFGTANNTLGARPDARLEGGDFGDTFGHSVASAGDVNGDGLDDIIVGAPMRGGSGGVGQAYVYFGSAGAAFDTSSDGVLRGTVAGDFFGMSVASTGDVNGDGLADLIVGAPDAAQFGGRAGQASIYFGAAKSSFDTAADGSLTSSVAGDGFGESVALNHRTRCAEPTRTSTGSARTCP